ncbi:PREDICTED: uncharacterized protein LOC109175269 [Ipomoea nil]|uniref:uncharacterized protein LOC109175269 n=1 Tax=Ipomoea nil TaxID=35883 RepID=UPI000901B788|nr:PREDICTED: uncharacterized protein LOC109175269 [Ipomoea nil]
MTRILSELSSPAATHRSPEDQDLLERSTRKPKRLRGQLESPLRQSSVDAAQETPTGDELMSPDQWKTPVATPINAWGRKEVISHPQPEIVSDDDAMEDESFVSEYPIIRVTKEEKERLRRPWRRSLILKVLGRTVSYSYLQQRLQKMWKTEAHFDLIALNQDYFIAKFESLRDYEYAKFEGPWMILDHYVVVQEWEPNFSPYNNKTKKLLAWVRFPDLPIEYFDEDFLKKIGKTVGRPIKIDTATHLASKGKFARLCVEIDISKPLLSKFVLNFMEWTIEYEGIHLICFNCGCYGHRSENCSPESLNKDNLEGDLAPTTTQIKNSHVPKEKYGTWMLVTRKERRRPRRDFRPPTETQGGRNQSSPKNSQEANEDIGIQSRFTTLQDLDDTGTEQNVEGQERSATTPQPPPSLPRIRTKTRNMPVQTVQLREGLIQTVLDNRWTIKGSQAHPCEVVLGDAKAKVPLPIVLPQN